MTAAASIEERVSEALIALGVPCSLEYPGFVLIPMAGELALATSAINDTWTVDLQDRSGRTIRTWDTGIGRTCDDPQRIADAVRAIAVRWSDEGAGGAE